MSDETPKWEKRAANNDRRKAELKAARAKLVKPKRLRSPLQYVYFIKSQEFVKIGWATAMDTRLVACEVNNPHPVSLIALMVGGRDEEQTLHAHFRADHHRGEWFRIGPAIQSLVDEIAGLDPIDARVMAGGWFVKNTGSRNLLLFPRNIQALRKRELDVANAVGSVTVALPGSENTLEKTP